MSYLKETLENFTRNNISVSNENIKKIFGEKYFNFLVSEKII